MLARRAGRPVEASGSLFSVAGLAGVSVHAVFATSARVGLPGHLRNYISEVGSRTLGSSSSHAPVFRNDA
jgi:hypothetical protein